MNSFTDYYVILGVNVDAPPSEIKTAFKKLALQYHPDVYKGEDAQERMRILLQAYQTLNDPVARKNYDASRAEYLSSDGLGQHRVSSTHTRSPFSTSSRPTESPVGYRPGSSEVSPSARRDRQRHYAFPDIRNGQVIHVDLGDMTYTLSPDEAQYLRQEGLLRGVLSQREDHGYFCHRCRHCWAVAVQSHTSKRMLPLFCPKCQASDWMEYLLLRCVHCCAIFESEQIRYEIGVFNYGSKDAAKTAGLSGLCPPYELFPLCPYCGTANWCPAEDIRVKELRARRMRRDTTLRVVWMSVAVIAVILVGSVAFALLGH